MILQYKYYLQHLNWQILDLSIRIPGSLTELTVLHSDHGL
jgi:hypothetical protein